MRRRSRYRAGRGPAFVMPGLLALTGLAFLLLSVVPSFGSQPPTGAEVYGFGSLSVDQLQTVNEIRPQKAQAAPGDSPTTAPPRPVKQPVPTDALPVTRAQPMSGPTFRPATSANSQDTAPIRVAIASHLSDRLLLSEAMAALSTDPSLQVYAADLSSLDRPDVLLILDESTTGASVWFCGPSPNESSLLAAAVLPYAQGLGQEPDEAIGSAVDESLSCSTLHAGRARMAAVDVRVPAAEAPTEQLAQILTQGVRSYLDEAESRIRRNRTSNAVTWPAYGPITSHYGPDHVLGIDIGQWEGDVVAATDGFVTFAGGDACCSYGLYVIVESPDGITTLYGHLDELYVKGGDEVRAGQPLGPVGNTGHSSGVHLHFETLVEGVRVNPLSVLP